MVALEKTIVLVLLLASYLGWTDYGRFIEGEFLREDSRGLDEEGDIQERFSNSKEQGGEAEGEPLSDTVGSRDGGTEGGPTEEPREQERTSTMADRISYCESGDTNTKNSTSSASGYFQFIDSTWAWVTDLEPPAMAYSYDVQLEAFYTLWDEGEGASHWEPSRYCWEHENPWDTYSR